MNEILNLLYKNDGHEPDWAAIQTALHAVPITPDTVLELVQTFYAIYELDEPAEQLTLLHVLTEEGA